MIASKQASPIASDPQEPKCAAPVLSSNANKSALQTVSPNPAMPILSTGNT
jgi:hypothetical protein